MVANPKQSKQKEPFGHIGDARELDHFEAQRLILWIQRLEYLQWLYRRAPREEKPWIQKLRTNIVDFLKTVYSENQLALANIRSDWDPDWDPNYGMGDEVAVGFSDIDGDLPSPADLPDIDPQSGPNSDLPQMGKPARTAAGMRSKLERLNTANESRYYIQWDRVRRRLFAEINDAMNQVAGRHKYTWWNWKLNWTWNWIRNRAINVVPATIENTAQSRAIADENASAGKEENLVIVACLGNVMLICAGIPIWLAYMTDTDLDWVPWVVGAVLLFSGLTLHLSALPPFFIRVARETQKTWQLRRRIGQTLLMTTLVIMGVSSLATYLVVNRSAVFRPSFASSGSSGSSGSTVPGTSGAPTANGSNNQPDVYARSAPSAASEGVLNQQGVGYQFQATQALDDAWGSFNASQFNGCEIECTRIIKLSNQRLVIFEALHLRAMVFEKQNDLDRAIQDLNAALELYPDDAGIIHYRNSLSVMNPAKGAPAVDGDGPASDLGLNPFAPEMRHEIDKVYRAALDSYSIHRYRQCLTILNQADKPDDVYQVYWLGALAYRKLGDLEGALDYSKVMLQINRLDPDVIVFRDQIFAQQLAEQIRQSKSQDGAEQP
jgi:hypothetical protein